MTTTYPRREIPGRASAEDAIRDLYRAAGLAPPQRIAWRASPYSLACYGPENEYTGGSVGSVIFSRLDSFWDKYHYGYGVAHGGRRIKRIDPPAIMEQLRLDGAPQRNDLYFFRHEAVTLETLSLRVAQYLTHEERDVMRIFRRATRYLDVVRLYRDVCYACDLPSFSQMDHQGRDHCEVGPAMLYSDGWAVFALRGEWASMQDVFKARLLLERGIG